MTHSCQQAALLAGYLVGILSTIMDPSSPVLVIGKAGGIDTVLTLRRNQMRARCCAETTPVSPIDLVKAEEEHWRRTGIRHVY